MTGHRPRSGQRLVLGLCGLLAAPALLACEPSLSVPEANRVPIAEARVLGKMGRAVVLDYMGSPLAVTLDGTASRDPDGAPIKTYRWLSGTRVAGAAGSGGSTGGGAGSMGTAGASADDAGTEPMMMPAAPNARKRWVPNGAPPEWPEDVAQPMVMLGEGVFEFELWVIDEKNAVSEPSNLEVTVRTPLSPEVQACVETVFDTVSPACKQCVCSAGEMCRMVANESVCNETCWGLLNCIGTRCPTYMPGGDTACLASMCTSFLSGAGGATMIGSCVRGCAAQCRSGS